MCLRPRAGTNVLRGEGSPAEPAENSVDRAAGLAHTAGGFHEANRPVPGGAMSLVWVLGQSFLARADHPSGRRGGLGFSYPTSVTNAPRTLRVSRTDSVKVTSP